MSFMSFQDCCCKNLRMALHTLCTVGHPLSVTFPDTAESRNWSRRPMTAGTFAAADSAKSRKRADVPRVRPPAASGSRSGVTAMASTGLWSTCSVLCGTSTLCSGGGLALFTPMRPVVVKLSPIPEIRTSLNNSLFHSKHSQDTDTDTSHGWGRITV